MTDVCQLLKETRLSRGLSLEEVAQRTYIKLYYLEALEEAWLDKLPAPVHTFGYIRLYAKLLGLDGGALVAQFQQQKGINTMSNSGRLDGAVRPGAPIVAETNGYAAYKPNGTGANGTPEPVRESTPINGRPVNGNGTNGRGLSLNQLLGNATRASNGDSTPGAGWDGAEVARLEADARQKLAHAERQAEQLVRGAESYADDVLATLEAEIEKTLQIVRNGRQFLQLRRQPGTPGS